MTFKILFSINNLLLPDNKVIKYRDIIITNSLQIKNENIIQGVRAAIGAKSMTGFELGAFAFCNLTVPDDIKKEGQGGIFNYVGLIT